MGPSATRCIPAIAPIGFSVVILNLHNETNKSGWWIIDGRSGSAWYPRIPEETTCSQHHSKENLSICHNYNGWMLFSLTKKNVIYWWRGCILYNIDRGLDCWRFRQVVWDETQCHNFIWICKEFEGIITSLAMVQGLEFETQCCYQQCVACDLHSHT